MGKLCLLPKRNSGRMSGLNPSRRSSVQTLLHGVEGGGRQHEYPAQLSLQPRVVVDLHQPLPQPTVQPLAGPVQGSHQPANLVLIDGQQVRISFVP